MAAAPDDGGPPDDRSWIGRPRDAPRWPTTWVGEARRPEDWPRPSWSRVCTWRPAQHFSPNSSSSPFHTETGFGFDVIDVATQQQRFGAFPILFYGYNAASTLLTVLVSEPRGGVFEFVELIWQEGPGPASWQWVNVTTSLTTSAFVVWAVGRLPSRGRQAIAVASIGIVGNACLGFLYARDRIPALAGVLYALCFYLSLTVAAERLANDRARVVRAVAALSVLVLATGWTLRCIATHFALRDAAWLNPQEWAARTVIVSESSSDDEIAEAKLFLEMKKEALTRSAPDPRANPRWTHEWLERDGALR